MRFIFEDTEKLMDPQVLIKAFGNIQNNSKKNEISYIFYSSSKNRIMAVNRTSIAFFKFKSGSLLTHEKALKQAYAESGLYEFVGFIEPEDAFKNPDELLDWLIEKLGGNPLDSAGLQVQKPKPETIGGIGRGPNRVSLEKWIELALNAEEFREKHESRAVYNGDDGIVYCNARQAIINTYAPDIANDGKAGDQLYKSTKNGKPFMRKRWFIATQEQVIPLIYEAGEKLGYSIEEIDLILQNVGLKH